MPDIGIGIVGGGYMGKRHAVAMSAVHSTFETALRPRLVSVAATSLESASRHRDRFGFDRAAEDWQALVADPDVEAVIVTTYPETHRAIAEAAFALGKPVLCEKPLADTIENARAMAIEAARTPAADMIAFNYGKTPATQEACRLIAAGALGRIVHIRVTYREDYFADPRYEPTWRARGKLNGAIGDLGSHAIALLLSLGGPVAAVLASQQTVFDERGGQRVETEDHVDAILRFASGVQGNLHVSRIATGAKMGLTYEVIGTEGSLRFDQEDQNSLHLYRSDAPEAERGFTRILTGPAHPDMAAFCEGPGHGTGYNDQITIEARDFLAAIEAGTRGTPDFDHGLAVAEISEALFASSASGGWASVEGVTP
ncbi:MAG: Gfo/Idh/MocA family oxidoreductase [Pseudomonadota bacterium]